MDKESPIYDVIVIGAGINGSSAALHLARKGKNTALIEQFPAIHARGSSAGQTRISKRGHLSFKSFDAIISDSLKQWASLEKESGKTLLRPHKMNFIVKKDENETFDKIHSTILKPESNRVKTTEEFNEEYGTTFANNRIVIEDMDSGVLMAEKCLRTIQNLFKESGGKIIDEFPVGKISVAEDGSVLLNGSSGALRAESLVICAGPWTSKLLQPLGVDLPLRVEKVVAFYWPQLKGHKDLLFLNHDGKEGIYGLPATEYPGMVKICFHGGVECDPDRRDQGGSITEIREKIRHFIEQNIPWAGGQPAIEETCMYTMSPDNEMIIDRHPEHENIVFACGFSGAGFKTAPAVGKILSEMAVGGEQSFDVHEFSMNRFNN